MNNINRVFTWISIYQYPFTTEVQNFFILWSTNIYTLWEEDFEAFKKYLIYKNISTVTILSWENKIEYFVKDFLYKDYFETYFSNVKDHFLFWWEIAWIAMSEESFWIVWGNEEFLKFMINEIWEEKLANRLTNFIIEWNARKVETWASSLLNRENIIDVLGNVGA